MCLPGRHRKPAPIHRRCRERGRDMLYIHARADVQGASTRMYKAQTPHLTCTTSIPVAIGHEWLNIQLYSKVGIRFHFAMVGNSVWASRTMSACISDMTLNPPVHTRSRVYTDVCCTVDEHTCCTRRIASRCLSGGIKENGTT